MHPRQSISRLTDSEAEIQITRYKIKLRLPASPFVTLEMMHPAMTGVHQIFSQVYLRRVYLSLWRHPLCQTNVQYTSVYRRMYTSHLVHS